MTRLISARRSRGQGAAAALRQGPAGRERPALTALASPCARLGLGTAVLLVTSVLAGKDKVGPAEEKAFSAVNGLPDALYPPAWTIMQLGTLGAAPLAAGVAWLAGQRPLARRLLAGGTGTWAVSKLVKTVVHRPRPAELLPAARRRGRDATGLGYLSGHAGVAVALGTAAVPHLGRAGRAAALTAMPAVALSRVYVGAHLPLDILGGAALGLALDAAAELAGERPRAPRGPGSRGTAAGAGSFTQPRPNGAASGPDHRTSA